MNILENRTTPSAAEIHVARTEQLANETLTEFKAKTIESFRRTWYSDIPVQDQLAVMGTRALAAFTQHAKAVMFLIQSGIEMNPADYTPPLEYDVDTNTGIITIKPQPEPTPDPE